MRLGTFDETLAVTVNRPVRDRGSDLVFPNEVQFAPIVFASDWV